LAIIYIGGWLGGRIRQNLGWPDPPESDDDGELPANMRVLGLHGFSEDELLMSYNPDYSENGLYPNHNDDD